MAYDVGFDPIFLILSFLYVQPMLQELGKQNPQLVRLIQDHQADFLRLINEPVEGDGWESEYTHFADANIYFI